uniref:Uncharacterized protein n=1 Tax=Cacopsylla melanoneura TaxID=428564 RepID=A0A8D9E7G6_9HEMI
MWCLQGRYNRSLSSICSKSTLAPFNLPKLLAVVSQQSATAWSTRSQFCRVWKTALVCSRPVESGNSGTFRICSTSPLEMIMGNLSVIFFPVMSGNSFPSQCILPIVERLINLFYFN